MITVLAVFASIAALVVLVWAIETRVEAAVKRDALRRTARHAAHRPERLHVQIGRPLPPVLVDETPTMQLPTIRP